MRTRRKKGIRPEDLEKLLYRQHPRTQNGYGVDMATQALKGCLTRREEADAMFRELKLLSGPWKAMFYQAIEELIQRMPRYAAREVARIVI